MVVTTKKKSPTFFTEINIIKVAFLVVLMINIEVDLKVDCSSQNKINCFKEKYVLKNRILNNKGTRVIKVGYGVIKQGNFHNPSICCKKGLVVISSSHLQT